MNLEIKNTSFQKKGNVKGLTDWEQNLEMVSKKKWNRTSACEKRVISPLDVLRSWVCFWNGGKHENWKDDHLWLVEW